MYQCNNFVSSDNEIVPLHTVWTVNDALNCVPIVQTFFAQKIFLFLQGSSSHSCPGWMGYRKNFFMANSPKFNFQFFHCIRWWLKPKYWIYLLTFLLFLQFENKRERFASSLFELWQQQKKTMILDIWFLVILMQRSNKKNPNWKTVGRCMDKLYMHIAHLFLFSGINERIST